ncbi:hypothetical protein [Candidatus Magnetomonas plexicatena]|uniref:hypothetical protein n=1 Tax=Candidatus Magnetomonas plexicatena TaxID=2552947 RepID=UPI00110052CF|nr:hypothetical protein E2O03_004765 [Nitrospirales bacterium LBB_01]
MAMVAVADILGFSSLVKQEPLSKIVNYHIKNLNNLLSSIPSSQELPESPTNEQIIREWLVGHTLFSDTVILYSLQDTREGYYAVIARANEILSRPIQFPALRFRIGISYGEFYCNPENNIYVGKALIEAYELEQKQNWCGAALTEAAYTKIKNYPAAKSILSPYDVPIKNGKKERHNVINWTLNTHPLEDKEYGWLSRENIDSDAAEEKIRNTERFHAEMCNQCKEHRKKLANDKLLKYLTRVGAVILTALKRLLIVMPALQLIGIQMTTGS